MKSSSFRTASTLAAVALGAGMSAQAATMAWTGASSTAFDVTTNWDGGFPATPNLGTIGTTGDTVGPYSVNIVNRGTIVNTNITVYGTSTITAQGAPRRSWALTLRDYSKFLPLDGTLDTVASSGGSGVFIDIHDHAEWTGWDRQQDANTTVNLYDDGKFQFNRWYAGDANIYGGTFTVGDITGFASTDNILLNLGPGSTGSLTIATYTKAMYETLYAATDAEDRLRYNGSNTAPFDSVFMVTGNTLTVIPEPSPAALLGLALPAGLLLRRRRHPSNTRSPRSCGFEGEERKVACAALLAMRPPSGFRPMA